MFQKLTLVINVDILILLNDKMISLSRKERWESFRRMDIQFPDGPRTKQKDGCDPSRGLEVFCINFVGKRSNKLHFTQTLQAPRPQSIIIQKTCYNKTNVVL